MKKRSPILLWEANARMFSPELFFAEFLGKTGFHSAGSARLDETHLCHFIEFLIDGGELSGRFLVFFLRQKTHELFYDVFELVFASGVLACAAAALTERVFCGSCFRHNGPIKACTGDIVK